MEQNIYHGIFDKGLRSRLGEFPMLARLKALFYIAPGHDSWVVGDEPYVSLHFMGAGDYARGKK